MLALVPDEDARAGAAGGSAQTSGLPATAKAVLAVMFTDIVGSTEFFSRKGDAAGMRMLEKRTSSLLPVLESYGGVPGDVASRLDEPFRSLCKGLGLRALKGIPQPLDLIELAWE